MKKSELKAIIRECLKESMMDLDPDRWLENSADDHLTGSGHYRGSNSGRGTSRPDAPRKNTPEEEAKEQARGRADDLARKKALDNHNPNAGWK